MGGLAMTARQGSKDQLTARAFLVVEVVLVAIPLVYLGVAGVLNAGAGAAETLRALVDSQPAVLVTLVAACAQPFAAYLLRFVQGHHERGDGGYALGNLICLLMAEMLMQNVAGIAGMLVLIWRCGKMGSPQLGPWVRERTPAGVLADISGALVLLLIAGICAFANWRLASA